MRLEFHRNVASDIFRIIEYYEAVAGPNLADDFYRELRSSFKKAANSPEAFDTLEQGLKRVNLERFPYHFLFRIVSNRVRVLVVRHHRRRPSLNLHRR